MIGDLYRYTVDINILITDSNDNCRKRYVLKSGNVLFEFNDSLKDNILKRKIDKHILIINNNTKCLLSLKSLINAKVIDKNESKKFMIRDNKIITFDIEAYKDKDNYMIPYACGWYDGENSYLYYLSDFKSSKEMLMKSISDIMIPKYNRYSVYMHNMQNFDGVLLFKYLLKEYNVKPMLKDNRLIAIKLRTLNKPYIRITM